MNSKIIFKDNEHKNMYFTLLKKCNRADAETKPVMYLLALTCNIDRAEQMFNFKEMCIKADNFEQPWQTSSSARAIRLAFVLWNGFPTEEKQELNSVYNIFGYSSWDKYFLEAIKLRYLTT
ncbi:MAG: DUF6075 family protein [Acutalibacteraceae bacterium]|nr:DUF6075 family protein [Acutalibacteraceae bacterium]